MTRQLTHLILLVTLAAGLATAAAWARLQSSSANAAAAERDLVACQADLADLTAWHVAVAAPSDPAAADDAALNRQVRRAAAVAAVADELVSVEPGPPVRVRDSDVLRTPVYLRLEVVSLRQTVAFLHALSAPAGSLRATGIELSAPTGPAATARPSVGEVWTADLTVSETSLARPGS